LGLRFCDVRFTPAVSATLTRAPGKSFNPLCTMASNTGWVSVGELLMTFRISAVAACCSNASLNSRLSRATFVSRLAGDELGRRMAFGVNALWRRALSLPPVLSRRLIASP